jgi:serine/threonine protein kinase
MARTSMMTHSTMDPSGDWHLLQQLFYLAEETPEQDRERVLGERCADAELVSRALRLISGSAALLERAQPAKESAANRRIGAYTLLRLLGNGGIGTVYLAERLAGGAVQQVALKMLSPHAAGTFFTEHFQREQHILGCIVHPNITRLLDAGRTELGQQYLVMEYVDGEHFDRYCDHHKLAIVERLRLFLCVCEAVAYAHRNLIVHLDLKPSNVLVSQEGAVKLLDFGTSKLIQPNALLTSTIVATPGYCSPEQLRNEPVTTACDVYSLGAILFELLAGRRPYADASAGAMMERAFTEQPPESLPSAVTAQGAAGRGASEASLRQMLAGDLETIAQKCLEAQPQDRYASVDALAQDVRLYLGGEPILARRSTLRYRLGKFLRRHRTGAAAGMAASLLLAGALSYAFWRQEQALREAERAERMQHFMHQLFRLANSNFTGKPAVTVPEFLQLGVRILPDYVHNPSDMLQAKVALAESMFDNGDSTGAIAIFAQTATEARALGNKDAEAESDAFSGHIDFLQGKVDDGKSLTAAALALSRQEGVTPMVRVWAEDFYASDRENLGLETDENLSLLRAAADEARSKHLPAHDTAEAIYNYASVLEYLGKLDAATPLYQEALNGFHQDPDDVCDPSLVYGDIGYLHELENDHTGAIAFFQRAYDGYKTCSGAASRDALSMLGYMGGSLVNAGQAAEAIRLLEAAWPDWEKIPGGYVSLGEFPLNLANAYVAVGRYADAEKLSAAIITARKAKIASSVSSYPEFILSESLAGQHRYQEALVHADIALRAFRKPNPRVTLAPAGVTLKAQVEQNDAAIRSQLGLPGLP